MAIASVSKSPKWFFPNNKFFKLLNLHRLIRPTSAKPSPPNSETAVLSSSNGSAVKEDGKLRQVFDHFDIDKDGKISINELMAYFESVGEAVTHKVAKRVIDEFDSNGDDLLEYGDFVRMVEVEKDVEDDVMRSAFEMFEIEKGSGCITARGLQNMLRQLGEVKSQEECAAMIGVFDLDGNGFLDFHEFQQMMSPTS